MLKFNISKKVKPKIFFNIGALLDIPTGTIIIGANGESIINGGLGAITGIIGAGNNYKSTIMHFMMLSAASKIFQKYSTAMLTYDTEVNISLERLNKLASNFDTLPTNITYGDEPTWAITDKSMLPANEWALELIENINNKEKNAKSLTVTCTAFRDPYTKGKLQILLPTFVEIDSLSEFESEATISMLSKDLDSSETNTYAMKQGAFKSKFLSQIPRLSGRSNTYFLLSAHIGEKIDMATGPAKYNQPTKKLQYLKSADTIKGATSKFNYLLNNAWIAHTATLLKNQTTKKPEYPINDNDVDTDLNIVKLTQLRGKNGTSGYTLEIIVSQLEGVLPTLTEFHYVRQNNRFGIDGNNVHYNMTLLPDVKLSRTTIRAKIKENPKLRKAIGFTSDLLQATTFYPELHADDLICTPEELYNDIKALGYDWDILLDTRSYWLIDQYDKNAKPFLSIIDLLKMRKGLYKPYWYKLDKDKNKE